MAKIIVIGSSSKGNGYIIETSKERLILECGCRWIEMMKACKFKLSTIQGCLVTHEHDDHARFIGEYADKGISVLAPKEVFERKNVNTVYCKKVDDSKGYILGGFKVRAVQAFHDVVCVSWIIEHEEIGKIVFATDTYTFPYRIPGVSLWMIEANYSDSIVDERVFDGDLPMTQRNRLMTTHMEIGNTIKTLGRNFDTRDRKPWMYDCILIHLSDGNSNAEEFIDRVKKEARMSPIVADKGMVIDLSII